MKYLVASDIHGSWYFTQILLEIIKKENPDKVILLGDLYYHGPRNGLSMEYDPMKVAKAFNEIKDKLEVIKGNCDAEVDEMISEFKFQNYIRKEIGGKRFFFTHGHHYNIDNLPDNVDVLVYGHFHTGYVRFNNGVVCINAGSISLPKNATPNSYLIIDEEQIYLKDLNGELIDNYKY